MPMVGPEKIIRILFLHLGLGAVAPVSLAGALVPSSSLGDESLRPRKTKCGRRKQLKKVVDDSPFGIFNCVADLGYFGWKPSGKYKNLEDATVADFTCDSILYRAEPTRVLPLHELRRKCRGKNFRTLSPQKREYRFPYNPSHLPALAVAANDRRLDLGDVDFMFGRSTLNMLAARKTTHESDENCYLAQGVSGTDVVLVARHCPYTQDYSVPGFQFERLATGGRFEDLHEEDTVEHLHVMDVGESGDDCYRILFSGEVDSIDECDAPVELKISHPANWGINVMLSMLAGGSMRLYSARRSNGKIYDIKLYNLQDMMTMALKDENVNTLESNILDGINCLKDAASSGSFLDGKVLEINFQRDRRMVLSDARKGVRLLPSDKVVRQVLNL